MINKKRLEEVVKNVVFNECGLTGALMSVELPEDDYWYLYEQTERVQELESDSYNAYLERLLDRKEQEIERYREALKNIYDLAEYNEYDNTLEQIVSEVEKALEELE